jgi:hypothetical protein
MADRSRYTLTDIEALDLEDIIESVRGAMRCNSREEAEDAVSETIIRTIGRLDKLENRGRLDGFIVHAAKEKVLNRRRLRESGNLSLDFLEEAQPGEERSVKPVAVVEDDIDSAVTLGQAEDDPILKRLRAIVEQGGSPNIMPRGTAAKNSRYSDGQVAEVRRLAGEGIGPTQIEAATGVPVSYVSMILRRDARVTESCEGWTPGLVILALQSFHKRTGMVPRIRDSTDAAMPSDGTVSRLFGSWRQGVEAAGFTPARAGQRLQPWSELEAAGALMAFKREHGAWPSRAHLVEDPDLPSPATVFRKFGSIQPRRFSHRVRKVLADAKPDPVDQGVWDSDRIVKALRQAFERSGTIPHPMDSECDRRVPSLRKVGRHFITWRVALVAAGIDPGPPRRNSRRWTKLAIAETLLAFKKRYGRWPVWAEFKMVPELPQAVAVRRLFKVQSASGLERKCRQVVRDERKQVKGAHAVLVA